MIIVTGATGQLGGAIVERLARRIPAAGIGVSVRNPEKATELVQLGVRVRRGDFAEPESLADAFEGAEQVLIVSSNGRSRGEDSLAQHRTAIDAALKAGAKRILYTSHMAASHTSLFPPMLDHAATEDMLRECGVAWTALRNGFYAQSALTFMGNSTETGLLEVPSDGKVSWTTHQDLAEATAAILTGEPQFEGPTPPLTGAEALDLADLADICSQLLGKPVQRAEITEDEFQARLVARGMPLGAIRIVLGFYQASRNGEFGEVNNTLQHLIGHRPTLMRDQLAHQLKV